MTEFIDNFEDNRKKVQSRIYFIEFIFVQYNYYFIVVNLINQFKDVNK